MAHEHIFVFFGYLLGYGLNGVIELGEGILLSYVGAHAMLHQVVVHVAAERLGFGEEHAALAHRVAFHVVEIAIGVSFIVVVEAVGA